MGSEKPVFDVKNVNIKTKHDQKRRIQQLEERADQREPEKRPKGVGFNDKNHNLFSFPISFTYTLLEPRVKTSYNFTHEVDVQCNSAPVSLRLT